MKVAYPSLINPKVKLKVKKKKKFSNFKYLQLFSPFFIFYLRVAPTYVDFPGKRLKKYSTATRRT